MIQVYKVTQRFPKKEKFGMVSDMMRAVNSAIHNISEGFGRYEKLDKTRFYKISRGSCYELISQLLTSHAIGYIVEDESNNLIEGVNQINSTASNK